MSPAARKTSDVIQQIIQSSEHSKKISVGEFVELLGARGFCLIILIFSLPNSLPVPGIPGFSTITGLPIMLIALQMMVGRETVWLPQALGRKTFSRIALAKMLKKALPWVTKLERYLSPRLAWMRNTPVRCLLGLVFFILAFMISLPIPGGNFLPGLSMSLIALAVLQRDGVFLILALILAGCSSYFMYAVIVEFFSWLVDMLQEWF